MWLLGGYTWVASRQLLDETGRQGQNSAVGQAPSSLISMARMRIGSFNQAWLDEGQDRAAEKPGEGQVRIVHDCLPSSALTSFGFAYARRVLNDFASAADSRSGRRCRKVKVWPATAGSST